MTSKDPKRISLIVGLLSICTLPALAQEDDLLEALGGDAMISLAVGYEQPLSEAPAVATVVTAEDIAAIGAYDIADILTKVTGFHVSKKRVYDDLYIIRSVASELNPHVLVMVNGVPIGDAVQGGRPLGWSMPVQNISRIEIIRGPGSALYGADAFAGTINIVTKNARELEGFRAGAIGGSFDTYGGWAQIGIVRDQYELALSFEGQTSDGDGRFVSFDAQTASDFLLGTNASLAPGPISTGRTDINLRADLSVGDHLTVRAAYQGLRDIGVGLGGSFALDPEGQLDVNVFTGDVNLITPVSKAIEMVTNVSVFHEDFGSTFQTFPPGAFGSFPEGVHTAFDFKLTEIRGNSRAQFSGIEGHTIVAGVGVTHQRSHDIDDRRNFFQSPSGVLVLAPGFLSAQELGVLPNALPRARTNIYGYIQDEWRIAPDWTITAGARIDYYSSFGETINPRASVVWTASPGLTVKALYGRAFRPPTFLESTEGAGQIAIGNPDLKPEMTDTFEFVIQKNWGQSLKTSINGYFYQTDDLITIAPDLLTSIPTFMNSDGTNGYGVELDADLQLAANAYTKFGYAFQKSKFRTSDDATGFAPTHQAYAEARWRVNANLAMTFGVKYVGERQRAPGDLRETVNRYFWGTAALRYSPDQDGPLFATLTVDNIFNADAREPSTDQFLAPEDIPLSGRQILGRVGVRF
ncbi:TonB-dependent receptor plug domain-containing protein [Hyphococcus sp.]|uniref:TonB-dependent receptor plug domain-containing protein n=1 Tax=Hyphococcus sp. TaxID=2038636 RepID=UPI0035C6F30F